jgi:hypothetical protein
LPLGLALLVVLLIVDVPEGDVPEVLVVPMLLYVPRVEESGSVWAAAVVASARAKARAMGADAWIFMSSSSRDGS